MARAAPPPRAGGGVDARRGIPLRMSFGARFLAGVVDGPDGESSPSAASIAPKSNIDVASSWASSCCSSSRRCISSSESIAVGSSRSSSSDLAVAGGVGGTGLTTDLGLGLGADDAAVSPGGGNGIGGGRSAPAAIALTCCLDVLLRCGRAGGCLAVPRGSFPAPRSSSRGTLGVGGSDGWVPGSWAFSVPSPASGLGATCEAQCMIE